jgi:hypothetical protein
MIRRNVLEACSFPFTNQIAAYRFIADERSANRFQKNFNQQNQAQEAYKTII